MNPEKQSINSNNEFNIEVDKNIENQERSIETQPISSQESSGNNTSIYSDPVVLSSLPKPIANDDEVTSIIRPNSDLIASDKDLIEKEWVNKAKNIINQNKNNPYKQEKEFDALKGEYKEKRYGKDLDIAA